MLNTACCPNLLRVREQVDTCVEHLQGLHLVPTMRAEADTRDALASQISQRGDVISPSHGDNHAPEYCQSPRLAEALERCNGCKSELEGDARVC